MYHLISEMYSLIDSLVCKKIKAKELKHEKNLTPLLFEHLANVVFITCTLFDWSSHIFSGKE